MSASKDELSGTGNEKTDPWLSMVVIAMGQALISFNLAALPIPMGGMV